MVSQLISRVAILSGGMLYPAYRSYKAVRTKDVREYVKWMMYWIVFAIFCCVETFTDMFVAWWCPFYYELKILFVLYLLTPYTKGASVIYRKFIHPSLVRHERDIDILLDQARNETVHTIRRLGSHTLVTARDLVANAAVKGQAQLIQQLARSRSVGDVNEDIDGPRKYEHQRLVGRGGVEIEEIVEEDMDYIDNDDLIDGADGGGGRFNRAHVTRRVYTGYRDTAAADAASAKPPLSPNSKTRAHTLSGPGHEVYDGYATVSYKAGQAAAAGAGVKTRSQAKKRSKLTTDTFNQPNDDDDEMQL